MDSVVNFYRYWNDYVHGFGTEDGNIWIGLEYIHLLTANAPVELEVTLESFDPTVATGIAYYGSFHVGGADENYTLTISNFLSDGYLNDKISPNNGKPFSTRDRNNYPHENAIIACPDSRQSGWWFGNCAYCNLNGPYRPENSVGNDIIFWKSFDSRKSIKRTEMKIHIN